jgi:hypothetical protein
LAIGEPKRTNQIKVLGDVTGRSTERNNIYRANASSIEEMRKILSAVAWIVAAMMALPLVAAPAMADGVSWKTTSNPEVWSHVQERSQFSIINYHDGYEKMIISIQVAASELQSGTRMFWLFPIPSNPEDIQVDLVSDVPRLEGSPYGDKVMETVAADPMWYYCVLGSQLWPVIFAPFYVMTLGIGGPGGIGQTVDVFESADKYGLHSEVILADNSSNLQAYLGSQGMTIPGSDLVMITDYINSGFSFVSTRIDSLQNFRQNATTHYQGGEFYYMMGVEVDFPSDEIFFPLKLTSAYGDTDIPITVQVLDFVDITTKPNGPSLNIGASYAEIEDHYELYNPYSHSYPRMSNESVNQTLAFFEEQIGTDWASHPTYDYYLGGKFTEIRIDGKASSLNSDLWMRDEQPASVSTIDFLIANSWIIILAIFISISTMAGLIAGSLLDSDRKHAPQYLLIGLSNVLTVWAPTLLYMRYHARWNEEWYREVPDEKKALRRVGWTFFAIYTIIFLSLSFSAWGLVSL